METLERDQFNCQVCDTVSNHKLMYHKNTIPVFRCELCGVGQAIAKNFKPDKYYIDEYFSGGYAEGYIDYAGSEVVLRREFKKTVKYLLQFCKTGGKCLEIGCAYGFFLQEAKRFFEVYGVEISVAAVHHCKINGLNKVYSGNISESLLQEIGKIDVAVLLDVIEHFDELDHQISLISAALKPGAVCLITTGDWSSFFANLTKAKWRLMSPPGHLWYFTPNSLDILMKRFGLIRVDISYPWKIVPFNLIVNQLFLMLGWKPHFNFPKIMSNYGILSNLFDTMRVVYKRV